MSTTTPSRIVNLNEHSAISIQAMLALFNRSDKVWRKNTTYVRPEKGGHTMYVYEQHAIARLYDGQLEIGLGNFPSRRIIARLNALPGVSLTWHPSATPEDAVYDLHLNGKLWDGKWTPVGRGY
jgi:hypothetical protein